VVARVVGCVLMCGIKVIEMIPFSSLITY